MFFNFLLIHFSSFFLKYIVVEGQLHYSVASVSAAHQRAWAVGVQGPHPPPGSRRRSRAPPALFTWRCVCSRAPVSFHPTISLPSLRPWVWSLCPPYRQSSNVLEIRNFLVSVSQIILCALFLIIVRDHFQKEPAAPTNRLL